MNSFCIFTTRVTLRTLTRFAPLHIELVLLPHLFAGLGRTAHHELVLEDGSLVLDVERVPLALHASQLLLDPPRLFVVISPDRLLELVAKVVDLNPHLSNSGISEFLTPLKKARSWLSAFSSSKSWAW